MKTKFNINIYQTQKKDFKSAFYTNALKFALFPNDNAVTSAIIQGWQYEFYMFEFLERNHIETTGRTIVDVGANNGNFAVDFAHLVGDTGCVHSFEPQRIIYYQLCGNVFMNGLDNVYCHNVALGDVEGFTYIEVPNYYDNGPVNFGDVKVAAAGEQVRLTTLDSYHFKDVVFIKIDVQGHEGFVLEGARRTIEKHRPYLFIEFEDHLLKQVGSSEAKLQADIESMGYIVKRFQEGIPYQTVSGNCLDCVCIPKEKFEEFKHIIP